MVYASAQVSKGDAMGGPRGIVGMIITIIVIVVVLRLLGLF
jgi:hypothetical protein